MACSKLDELPAELVRKIAVKLPSSAALALMLACRYTYVACNDWTVWREVVAAQCALGDSAFAVLGSLTKPDWKRYVVADALARQNTPANERDVEMWLPHMIILQHPAALSKDDTTLFPLCDVICDIRIGFNLDSKQPWLDFETCVANVNLPWNLQTWRFAQAASFCLTSQRLASTTPCKHDKPPRRLCTVQWLRLTDHHGHNIRTEDDSVQHIAMLHALANRAVGFFHEELQWVLSNDATYGSSTAGLMALPTISTLPIPTLSPPVPLVPGALESFSTCHIAMMTEPSFFLNDEWTGYTFSNAEEMYVDGIGGHNLDVASDRLDELPNPRFPFRVERYIRFQFVREWAGGDQYLLESNCYYSQGRMDMLKVIVNKVNGHLKIAHRHPLRSDWAVLDAVITPFGVVESFGIRARWAWYWKCGWSSAN
ncbi:hypothetical protein PSPO01_16184 [Paraphaeosphaeria sporulosa]